MMLVEETQIPVATLPVADLKAHLRLGTGFADEAIQDGVLEGFLRAALAAIEARTGQILIARDFSWLLTRWRKDTGQSMPVAPVTAVTELRLIDADGAETAVDVAQYWLEQDGLKPVLRPRGACLPTIVTAGQVQVFFTAGFGAAWSDVPVDLQQAVLLLAAHYYEFRHETSLGGGCMPFGVTSLIERYRPLRIGFEDAS
ncbi:MAG: head-tail connector protein [Cognatishimia sp.]